jgi:hypothetical protein
LELSLHFYQGILKSAANQGQTVDVTKLQEIEQAIAGLPREDFFELVRYLRERHSKEWDKQIQEDAEHGRLQALHDRLDAENRGAPDIPLDDFLDQKELSHRD